MDVENLGNRNAARQPRGNPSTDLATGLAGSIAHDFSNLLMVIRTSGEFLQQDLPSDGPLQEHVSAILHAAERATVLTSQLQAFGRSQLLKPELVRPAQVIRGMSDTLRHLVPPDVSFRISIRAPDAVVLFDVSQLEVVILDLVTCVAERVASHGHLLLAVAQETFRDLKLRDGQILSGSYVTIVVAKTGEGMEEQEMMEVFGPHLAGKDLPSGTDLRLASVQGLVAQSGGFVDVASERGRGTLFRILLPVVTGGEPQTRLTQARMHGDVSGNEVILVVEDNASVRAIVRESLERYGYTVFEACDGAEAFHITNLFNTLPDLLLTDLVMPEVTGRELIESMRQEGRLPKVLLMSGYTDDGVLQRAKPAEAYPFIKKPFSPHELAAKVRETLDS